MADVQGLPDERAGRRDPSQKKFSFPLLRWAGPVVIGWGTYTWIKDYATFFTDGLIKQLPPKSGLS
jgi:hypothetical protein